MRRWAYILCFLSCCASGLAGDPRITEFLAWNESGLKDEDGENGDWIELANFSGEACDLAGWSLTDDLKNPRKWTFPALRLEAGSFLLVFASGKNRVDPAKPLHVNFKLGSEGDVLALVSPAGQIRQEFSPYPAQQADVSFGQNENGQWLHWRSPTPGKPNAHDPAVGPVVLANSHSPESPESGQSLSVRARFQPTAREIAQVALLYRVMQGPELSATMADNGLSPDEKAGDGNFAGLIPAGDLSAPSFLPGEMIRWAFLVTDQSGLVSRFPDYQTGQERPAYFGTVARDPSAQSTLPIMQFFPADAKKLLSATTGTRGAVYFQGRFHDNVLMRRRGQFGSITWPKPKLKFDFNPTDRFAFEAGGAKVDEFNLQSHYNDPSYMREDLAFQFFQATGTPAPLTRFWQVRMNGAYYGLFSCVEQMDEDFLDRVGLDEQGAMYKANGFPSTLARGTANKSFYQKITRKTENYADFSGFLGGINSLERIAFLMDNVNLPAMCNEMACQTILKNGDRLTKNYYMYRSPRTDLWERMPWDLDGAFTLGLDTENYASPLYGDTQHTQDPGQPIYQNFLYDVILDHKPTREMYLRRLRSLVDEYLSAEAGYFEREVDRLRVLIEAEAVLDNKKWKIGSITSGTNDIKRTFLTKRRRELTVTYGPAKNLVPEKQTPGLRINVARVEYRASDPDGEYFALYNPNSEAVDISGWRVEGALRYTFPPGTVIPKADAESPEAGLLFVAKNTRAFRNRTVWPVAGQRLFYLGGYEGRLAPEGEVIRLRNRQGEVVLEHSYLGERDPVVIQRAAFGLDKDAGGLPRITQVTGGIALRFQRPVQSPYDYELQSSSDLKTWTSNKAVRSEVSVLNAALEVVTLYLASGVEGYLRLAVRPR